LQPFHAAAQQNPSNLLNDAWDTFSRGPARREKPDVSLPIQYQIEDFIRDEVAPVILNTNVDKF
jgi:hypothetical protein